MTRPPLIEGPSAPSRLTTFACQELDYPDDALSSFDFIVASVHGQFRLDKKAQTQRILKAVANPFVTILGHMTGRQLLRRPGYEVDVDKLLAACAKHGVAVEINANPWRLDLDWRWLQRGLERGCSFSIDPDARDTDEIENVRFGVAMARKGGLPKARILNCLVLPAFTEWLHRRHCEKNHVNRDPGSSQRGIAAHPRIQKRPARWAGLSVWVLSGIRPLSS